MSTFRKARLRRTVVLVAPLAAAACGGGPTTPRPPGPPPTPTSIEISTPMGTRVDQGGSIEIEATVRDSAGNAIAHSVAFESSDPLTARIESTGPGTARVSGIDGGVATLRARIESGLQAELEVTVEVVFLGRVHTADGGGIDGLFFYLLSESTRDSVPVDPAGSFELRIARPLTRMAVSYLVDRGSRRDRAYFPSFLRDTMIQAGHSGITSAASVQLDIVLVPTQWTIQRGRWAGQRFPVSLQTAFAFPNAADGNFYARWRSSLLLHRQSILMGEHRGAPSIAWPERALPIPVLFLHEGFSDFYGERQPLTTADSTLVWQALDDLEDRLGRDLFRPAIAADFPATEIAVTDDDDVTRTIEVRPGTISVERFTDLPFAGLGDVEGPCSTASEIEERFCGPLPAEEYMGGRVQFRGTALRQVPESVIHLVQHEFIHALGFSHACFPSANIRCVGPFPFQDLPTTVTEGAFPATEYDAVFIELNWAVHEWVVRQSSSMGLMEALDGERTFVLGEDPLPRSYTHGPAELAADISRIGSEGVRSTP